MVLKHHHHYHFSYQLLTALTSSPLPFPSIFPPSLQPLLTYMARHHLPTWSWEPSLNLQHHYQHLHQAVQQEAHCEREHMFEKLLTPSDVGKLNRLVIPKQHAEKYFPLDGDSGKKGLLLSFEDESGKTWEFRYSYWSSSQSYVLTRGWSRFVKEKRLDTGDVVLFERPWFQSHRPYIRCRRRRGSERLPSAQTMTMANAASSYPTTSSYFSSMQQDRLLHTRCQMDEAVQSETVAPANSTRLRLFGVNLGCRPGPEPQSMTSTSWLLGQSACQFMPSNASTSQL